MNDEQDTTNSKKIGKAVTDSGLSLKGKSCSSPSALPFDIMYRGYFPLWRKLRDWEWYSNSNIKAVFLELLLLANHKKKSYQGNIILPGQCVTGRKKLSATLGLSEQQIRTALKRLKATNEITTKSCNKYSIITLNNFTKYALVTNGITNKEPASNQQITTPYNDKNVKNDNKGKIPPTLDDVTTYFRELEYPASEAAKYCDYYQSNGWKVGRVPMKDWRAAVRNWCKKLPKTMKVVKPKSEVLPERPKINKEGREKLRKLIEGVWK